MKRGRNIIVALLLAMALLAACTPATEGALPTLIPVDQQATTDAAQNTGPSPSPTHTLPPSDTPLPLVRPTLPPTFTPSPTASVPPSPTVFIPTPTLFIPPGGQEPESCSTFRIRFQESDREFAEGEAPRVSWNPVEDAELYRINLLQSDGQVLQRDTLLGTQYVFNESFFEFGNQYGWEAYPLDVTGGQMCRSIGGELIPRPSR
jgi:hypothetical protein